MFDGGVLIYFVNNVKIKCIIKFLFLILVYTIGNESYFEIQKFFLADVIGNFYHNT